MASWQGDISGAVADLRSPTRVQQQLHDVEVGVGDAVVQGRVAVPVGQVHHVGQEGWRELGEGQEVVGDCVGDGGLLAGQTEPLLQDQAAAGELRAASGAEPLRGTKAGPQSPARCWDGPG